MSRPPRCTITNLTLPVVLSDSLYGQLLPFKDRLTTSKLRGLRSRVREGHVPNYDEEWAEFSYLYFGANYLKGFRAVKHLPTKDSRVLRILDLGCGSGASTAGAVNALRPFLSTHETRLEITAVDRNGAQLRLYQFLMRNWLGEEKNIEIETRCCEALSFLRTTKLSWDVVLCSYVLEEQTVATRMALMRRLRALAKCGGRIVIIGSCPVTGRAMVQFLFDSHRSAFLLELRRPRIALGRLCDLNQHVKPMYGHD